MFILLILIIVMQTILLINNLNLTIFKYIKLKNRKMLFENLPLLTKVKKIFAFDFLLH